VVPGQDRAFPTWDEAHREIDDREHVDEDKNHQVEGADDHQPGGEGRPLANCATPTEGASLGKSSGPSVAGSGEVGDVAQKEERQPREHEEEDEDAVPQERSPWPVEPDAPAAAPLGQLEEEGDVERRDDEAGEGVNLGGPATDGSAVLKSRTLVEEFIKQNQLLPVLYPNSERPPTLWFGVNTFRSLLSIRDDPRAGLITISVDWNDPVVAANWANGFASLANEVSRGREIRNAERNIAYLNQQLQKTNVVEMQRVLYNLIEAETNTLMLANAREEYAFTVVDRAVPPEGRISPKRKVMVVFGTMFGLFLGVVFAFGHQLVKRVLASQRRTRDASSL